MMVRAWADSAGGYTCQGVTRHGVHIMGQWLRVREGKGSATGCTIETRHEWTPGRDRANGAARERWAREKEEGMRTCDRNGWPCKRDGGRRACASIRAARATRCGGRLAGWKAVGVGGRTQEMKMGGGLHEEGLPRQARGRTRAGRRERRPWYVRGGAVAGGACENEEEM